MRTRGAALLVVIAAAGVFAQGGDPRFEVVSIRPSAAGGSIGLRQLPGGGFAMTNGTLSLLMGQAFPVFPWELIGLPPWASSQRYDVNATGDPAIPNPTQSQRTAMLRAMLAERFKLAMHSEMREQDVYYLIRARTDGRIGPRLNPTRADCVAVRAAEQAARAAGKASASVPTPGHVPDCSSLQTNNRIEGDITLDVLTGRLRSMLRRQVIDKSGLTGYYRVDFEFAPDPLTAGVTADTPSIFTSLQEQLGLKLEPGRAPVEVLVVDRVEPPTPN